MEISLISGYAKREFHSNADSQDKYYRTMDSTSRWLTVETNCSSEISNVVAHASSRLADPKTWKQDAPQYSIKIVAFSSKAI
ncbi:hypothetical protein NC653_036489 [Populus alba x Populus x berolinensis]|uniref:Uncharacterized protein n=1 Tax=Populus alba x Populus x berolinensis TaxID=444605 RepID=A0AAD6PVU1_9ROSI|nr:hypothetical protein NC653_036489 [Populus alba x Populus x berolinensis]